MVGRVETVRCCGADERVDIYAYRMGTSQGLLMHLCADKVDKEVRRQGPKRSFWQRKKNARRSIRGTSEEKRKEEREGRQTRSLKVGPSVGRRFQSIFSHSPLSYPSLPARQGLAGIVLWAGRPSLSLSPCLNFSHGLHRDQSPFPSLPACHPDRREGNEEGRKERRKDERSKERKEEE